MNVEHRELELLQELYAATIEPARWARFATALAARLDGATVTLAVRRMEGSSDWAYYSTGEPISFLGEQSVRDELDRALQRADLVSGLIDLGNVYPDVDLADSDFFRDWLRPRHIDPVWPLCHAVSLDRQVVCWLLVQPPDPSSFDRDGAAALGSRLVPHLRRALGIARAIGARGRERRALEEVLDRLPTGVILVDADRRVSRANLSATRMLMLGGGLHVRNGELRADREADDTRLQKGIDDTIDATSRGSFDHIDRVTIGGRRDLRPFQVSLFPLLGAIPGSPEHDAVIAVVFGSPDAISRASIQALGEVYGLTAAESGVVRGLVEGHSIEEVAARRKVKTETARGQLKQVFAKTGTTRQAELIRLVLTGVSPLSQPQSAQPGGERIP